MKSKVLLLFLSVALFGCKKEISAADIANMNGYWEIEKVILPDGATKDYKVNTTVDYIKLDGGNGIRKKLTPQLDGKYLENGTSEAIDIVLQDGRATVNYRSDFAQWKEEIIAVGPDRLVLRNDGKLEYHYKRPIAFSKK